MLMRATLDSLGESDAHAVGGRFLSGLSDGRSPAETATTWTRTWPTATFWPSRSRRSRPASPVSGSATTSTSFPASSRTPCLRCAGAGGRSPGWTATATTPPAWDSRSLYPTLEVGGYMIIDDYLPLDDCRRAVDDFRAEHGITEPIEPIDWSGARWRRESDAGPSPSDPAPIDQGAADAAPPPRPSPVRHATGCPPPRRWRCATSWLRSPSGSAAAEREIARLTGSPLRGPRAWARGRLPAGWRSRA